MTSSDKPNTESVPATDESSQTSLQPIDSPDIPEEVLEGLPEDHIPSAREAVGRFVSITEGFSGPIPPPRLLGQYEKLLPGSADRILRMAETEQSHRHSMERLIVERGLNLQFWGLGAGFVVTLILSIGGIHLLNTGRNVEGLAAIIVPLAALVGAFFYVRRKETKDQSTTDSSIVT